jgi:hypothetical protein
MLNDTTIQSYVGKNVYPAGIDIAPEKMPCITFFEVGTTILSVPRGMNIGLLQVDIWSRKGEIEVENIETRISQLLNYRDSSQDTFDGTLWWCRKQSVREEMTEDRKLFRKSIDYKFWCNSTDNL